MRFLSDKGCKSLTFKKRFKIQTMGGARKPTPEAMSMEWQGIVSL